jgi:hypothetical protein
MHDVRENTHMFKLIGTVAVDDDDSRHQNVCVHITDNVKNVWGEASTS